MNRFSEEVLSTTLGAVRSRRRRRSYRRGVTALLLIIGVSVILCWPSRQEVPLAADDVPEVVPDPSPAESETPHTSIHVFATADRKTNVILLADDELERMLQGRSYGTYVSADGQRRLWIPDS